MVYNFYGILRRHRGGRGVTRWLQVRFWSLVQIPKNHYFFLRTTDRKSLTNNRYPFLPNSLAKHCRQRHPWPQQPTSAASSDGGWRRHTVVASFGRFNTVEDFNLRWMHDVNNKMKPPKLLLSRHLQLLFSNTLELANQITSLESPTSPRQALWGVACSGVRQKPKSAA